MYVYTYISMCINIYISVMRMGIFRVLKWTMSHGIHDKSDKCMYIHTYKYVYDIYIYIYIYIYRGSWGWVCLE
jgi:hypothetical protein